MAQYDVYARLDGPGYLLDVQTDYLEGMATRIVVPLLAVETAPKPIRYLNPIFRIDGAEYVMVTQFLSAVQIANLGANTERLSHVRDEITRALDRALNDF